MQLTIQTIASPDATYASVAALYEAHASLNFSPMNPSRSIGLASKAGHAFSWTP